jgi:putative membrane protein
MMLRLIPALILVLVLIIFGLSNRQAVTLGFWPTDYAATIPLSVAILIGMAIAFVLGAAIVWLDHLGLGRRARRAEAQVARLQAQLAQAELRAQPPIIASRDLPPIRVPVPAGAPSTPLPPPEG